MAYIDLDEINRLHPKLTAKYPLSFANGISAAISEINKLPTADVVPKSECVEYEYKFCHIVGNAKVYTKTLEDYYKTRKSIEEDAKSKVAREIFAEIQKSIVHNILHNESYSFEGVIDCITKDLDELKKKYTEETK